MLGGGNLPVAKCASHCVMFAGCGPRVETSLVANGWSLPEVDPLAGPLCPLPKVLMP